MWSVTQSVGNFVWKNRGKLTVAAVIGIGAAVYYHYNQNTQQQAQQQQVKYEDDNNLGDSRKNNNNSGNNSRDQVGISIPSKEKSRLLNRARKQFDIVCVQFLATLNSRIVDVVDISAAIRQIKELRNSSNKHGIDTLASEVLLWEDIKIGSFTQLFVTIYMVSALCVLLRLQMHILAKTSDKVQGRNQLNTEFETSSDLNRQEMEENINNDMNINTNTSSDDMNDSFKKLINGTYKHIFSTGLRTLSSIVRQQVSIDLKDWVVNEKITVEYGELVQIISQIRRSIECDMSQLIKMMIIPPEAMDIPSHTQEPPFADIVSSYGHSYSNATLPSISPSMQGVASPSTSSNNNNSKQRQQQLDPNNILAQLWDVTESPMFAASLIEVCDSCFRIVYEQLRSNIFSSNYNQSHPHDSTWSPMTTPSLASLLPNIKAVTSQLLPSSSKQPLNIKELVSGPVLESLCLSVFDAALVQ